MSQVFVERVEVYEHSPAYVKISCSDSVAMELRQQFSFMAPNAKYDKRYQKKLWDGKIYLFKYNTRTILSGLKENIREYCKLNRYEYIDYTPKQRQKISEEEFKSFIDKLNLPEKIGGNDFELRDYQYEALRITASLKRCIIKSPTSSGKSLIMYLICRWFNLKTLMVVPTTTLVSQLAGDFKSYNYQGEVSQIFAGQDKEKLNQFTVSTWQSVHNMPTDWLNQFDVIIGDEAHTFTAPSLQKIMDNIGAKIRIGTTGTLENPKVHKLALQGMFGPIYSVTTTAEMIANKQATPIEIKAYDLHYPPEDIKKIKPRVIDGKRVKISYAEEAEFLYSHSNRTNFLVQLTLNCKGNTLLLFKSIEHGKILFDKIKEKNPNTHLVYGEIDTDIRDEVRRISENNNDVIIVATYKTFATGINIRNLHHVIFGAPIKAKNLIIQAIGRSLRLNHNKEIAYIHDVGDNLSTSSSTNYAYAHFIERLELYAKEKHNHKLMNVRLGDFQNDQITDPFK